MWRGGGEGGTQYNNRSVFFQICGQTSRLICFDVVEGMHFMYVFLFSATLIGEKNVEIKCHNK